MKDLDVRLVMKTQGEETVCSWVAPHCDKECVTCKHFCRLIGKLSVLETGEPDNTRLTNSEEPILCQRHDSESRQCCEAPGDSCYHCPHFKAMKEKLYQFEERRGAIWPTVWHPFSEPPTDGEPKLLHVWGCPDVQFVHAFYLPDVRRWSWPSIRGIDNDELAPVAWADLPVVPQDIRDAYTEDAHFKKTTTRRK